MLYTSKIKGFDSFDINHTEDIRLTAIDDIHYKILIDGKNFDAKIIEQNKETKTFKFNINGRIIDIQLQNDIDRLIDKMEFNSTDVLAEKELSSPMPGVILSIDVKKGDEVAIGDKLFTLEAMKMENIIKSTTDGIIQSIDVNLNEAVEKSQLLLSFE